MHLMKRAVLILPASVFLLLGQAGTGLSVAHATVSGHGEAAKPGIAAMPHSAARPDSGFTGQCNPSNHYYGLATSGTGSHGTAANIWTWKNWSVDSSGYNFSLQNVYLSDPNNVQYNFEVGFYSGWINDNLRNHGNWYTNGMTPYYAYDNGNDGWVQEGTYLPASTYINISASFLGSTDYAVVTGTGGSPIYMDQPFTARPPTYQDQANLTNGASGEVTDTKTWMGGGSGDSMTLFWVDYQGVQHPWSYLSYCDNSPYWASSSNNTDYFADGGYGNG